MGSSGGGGQNSPYFNFSTYTPPTYQEYVKKYQLNEGRNAAYKTGGMIRSEQEYNQSLQQSGQQARAVKFKKGTDIGALNYLLKNHPNHALFQQGGDAQARRDAGGNDAIMFDNRGNLDPIAHNALYVAGDITNTESQAYKDQQERIAGAGANKRNKQAAPIANAKGSKTTTGGTPAVASVQSSSKPGSILGGTDINEAVKTLLGG